MKSQKKKKRNRKKERRNGRKEDKNNYNVLIQANLVQLRMADDVPVDPSSLEPHDVAAALDTAIAEAETAKNEGNGKLKLGTKSGYLEAKELYTKGIQTLENAATQVHRQISTYVRETDNLSQTPIK